MAGLFLAGLLCCEDLHADDSATELKELKAEIKAQRAKLDAQEAQLNKLVQQAAMEEDAPADSPPPDAASPLMAGQEYRGVADPYAVLAHDDFPDSIPLFGSDWRFSFYGYIKADLIIDFSGTGDKLQFTTATIPVEGAANSPQKGSYANFHAKESRFGFEMRNVSEALPFTKAVVEMDFFDESSSAPRLRHAYFQYGHLVAGQTWTTVTDLRVLPYLVDFSGGDALYGGREALVRWEQPVSDHWSWALGIEQWSDSAIENPSGLSGTARSQLPMLAGRASYDYGRGVVTVGGSLAQLRWDGDEGVSDTEELQWAGVVTTRIYLTSEKTHYIGLSGSYGIGSAQNIISFAEGNAGGAVLRDDGSLEMLTAWNYSIGAHWEWSKKLSSNFVNTWAEMEHSDLRDPDSMEAGGATHLNLVYDVSKLLRVGVEFMTGELQNADGKDGRANRLQFMTMYKF